MDNEKDEVLAVTGEDVRMDAHGAHKKRFKRILALSGVVLLVLMYILCLIFAIMDFDGWQRYFIACLACTIAVPILLWINIFLYDRMMDKRKE